MDGAGGTLRKTLAKLRDSWEDLTFRAAGSCPSLQRRVGSSGALSDVSFLKATVSLLSPTPEQLAARAVNRTWKSALADDASFQSLLEQSKSRAVANGGRASRSEPAAVAVFRHGTRCGASAMGASSSAASAPAGELPSLGRLRGPAEPLAALADGSAAAIVERKSSMPSVPDLALAVFDVGAMALVGSVPLSQLPHGRSLQRPLTVCSLQGSVDHSREEERQACVLAAERLVAVFSWRLGGASGEVQLRDTRAEEVRFGATGKEVLRAASFVGSGTCANVAVLLSMHRAGHVVEVFSRCESAITRGSAAAYALRHTCTLTATPAQNPTLKTARAELHGRIALWSTSGSKFVDVAALPVSVEESLTNVIVKGEGSAAVSSTSASRTSRGGGSGAAFVRARQAARKGKLRVSSDGGAGLGLEPTRWGYLVEDVDEDPGQPDVKPGDLIIAISGQALHGLDDDAIHWRFGRNFGDGVEISIMPAQYARDIMELDAKGESKSAETRSDANDAAMQARSVSTTEAAEPCRCVDATVSRIVLPAGLEACCVLRDRGGALPALLVVADNRMLLTEIPQTAVPSAPRQILASAARDPYRRPTVCVRALPGSEVVLLGLARGAVFWRVPALLNSAASEAAPEFLCGLPMPPRCSLVGMTLGLTRAEGSSRAFGWCAAELSGVGADSNGAVDAWHFYEGQGGPPALAPPAVGRAAAARLRQGGRGDAVDVALAAAGVALDAVLSAVESAAPGAKDSKVARQDSAGETADATVEALRSWVSSLPHASAEALYAVVDRGEPELSAAARDLRRWLRHEQDRRSYSGGADASRSTQQRMDDARDALQYVEDVRRRILWPLQAAFIASDAEDSDGDDLPTTAPAPGDGGVGAALAEAAALRRQRWLRQRAAVESLGES
eukprot:TRINITY_DN14892_c0_g2_i1.p1 TRINITY_DN14892_c0_g2~~TRINITY_DN14892_c0_g2_i1.p1  ORF type:complete len:921 (+),score=171.87 TRINITY_DN14892_c0_g2_i1:54-2765(+)